MSFESAVAGNRASLSVAFDSPTEPKWIVADGSDYAQRSDQKQKTTETDGIGKERFHNAHKLMDDYVKKTVWEIVLNNGVETTSSEERYLQSLQSVGLTISDIRADSVARISGWQPSIKSKAGFQDASFDLEGMDRCIAALKTLSESERIEIIEEYAGYFMQYADEHE
ncbi:MAG: hypothetical protein U0525_04425, partial [Patescibacteria group bacterium]